MKKLIIDNLGPIQHVELNMKRVNAIIGPQSVGKSCVLKLACFCAWAEKRMQLEQGKNGFSETSYLEKNLVDFHRLNGFVRLGSRFSYESDFMKFSYEFDTKTFDLKWKTGHWKYHRSRISYIPAERNLVSVIPNWFDVNLGMDNLRSFISDWNLARQMCSDGNHLPILNLGIKYMYDESQKTDYILLPNGHQISLVDGSSGLQSVIPMWVYLDFLFHKQYQDNVMTSVASDSENEEILQHIYDTRFKKGLATHLRNSSPFIGKIGMGKRAFVSEDAYKECKLLFESYAKNHRSDIFLEEPEQNLFPMTQVELIYSLLQESAVHEDGVFIATHSPYVLYALNNCMLGYVVGKNIPNTNVEARRHAASWINPKDVAVWEMREGNLSSSVDEKYHTLQDKVGLIRGNYFDRIMKVVMTDFSNYSAYYG